MSTSFFNTPERIALLLGHSALWLDTPFRPHANVRGAGVDCVHLVAGIYIGVGAIDAFNPPAYVMDGGCHNRVSQVVEYVESTGRFHRLPELAPEAGDLLGFNIVRVVHHVAIAIGDDKFIHAIQRYGTIISDLNDPTWKKRLSVVYRPKPL